MFEYGPFRNGLLAIAGVHGSGLRSLARQGSAWRLQPLAGQFPSADPIDPLGIDQLAHRAAEDSEAATAVLDAEETLFELGQRIDKLRAVRGQPHLDAKALGIDEAPRLFARRAQTPKLIAGPRATRANKLIGQSINDPKVQQELGKLGYDLAKREKTGRLFRISRRSERFHELPHLSVDEEAGIIRQGKARGNFSEWKEGIVGDHVC
jgi:hypothetical protein